MSNVHTAPTHPQPHAQYPATPELAVLAAALHEAAQALLALQPVRDSKEAYLPGGAESAHTPAAPEASTAKTASPERDGETRSYYFPSAAVRQEKDLLLRHRAEDFQGLLEEVHTLLAGLVKIMRSVHKDMRVKGYVISSLGAQIDHASALVLRMRNIYGKVIPVRK